MEIFELRYFLGVARTENIHKASEHLRVSPASLSKAVTRIENELSVKLFTREGRNIHLTEQGKYLKDRATEILRLEESARIEIAGKKGRIHAVIAGPEVLLSHFGIEITERITKRHPNSTFEFVSCTDEQAIDKVKQGDIQLGIVSGEIPKAITSKVLGETEFKTVVGSGHPLYQKAKSIHSIPVGEVLKYGFVSPSHPWLGQVGLHQSSDGWRDDQFPRTISYQTSSLTLLEKLVLSGKAVAYLPDYLVNSLPLAVIKVAGCPYHCNQKIRLVAKRPEDVSWLNSLF